MADTRADVIALSDYVYERTRSRLDGLTDTEYFWEPVPICWTIRRAGSDKYQADHSDSPGIPPFTTIAWRLWHLAECYGGIRNPQWLGVERQPAGFERRSGTGNRSGSHRCIETCPRLLARPAPGAAGRFLAGAAGSRGRPVRRG
jgi:hypothetical protein